MDLEFPPGKMLHPWPFPIQERGSKFTRRVTFSILKPKLHGNRQTYMYTNLCGGAYSTPPPTPRVRALAVLFVRREPY